MSNGNPSSALEQPATLAAAKAASWHIVWYFALNLGFILLVAIGAGAGDSENPRALYLAVLFAVCSSPLLYARTANGPHVILTICLALYFFYYGIADLLAMFMTGGMRTMSTGLLSLAEVAVLLGALLISFGYNVAVAFTRRSRTVASTRDWPDGTALVVGLTLWLIGLAATWMWASEVVERHVVNSQLGPLEATAVTIARYLQPVGVALIAYKFVKSRGRFWSLLILGMLLMEFVFGFIADSKELSIRGAALVLVASYFLHGKIPKTWLVVAGLVVVVAFPVFQAYRFEVLQEGGQTRAQGASDLRKNLQRALDSNITAGDNVSDWSGVVGRLSLKPTMELIIARVGKDVSYQRGYTIELFFMGFIPRLIWPNKPDSSVGRLFNRQFGISADPDTYISATHLGELYWNFGWGGIILGAPLIGFILGYMGGRFCLADHQSLTRFLLLAVTVYFVCLRFEGSIAIGYTQWIRTVAMVLLLHVMFARVAPAEQLPVRAESKSDEEQASPAFLSNLMR